MRPPATIVIIVWRAHDGCSTKCLICKDYGKVRTFTLFIIFYFLTHNAEPWSELPRDFHAISGVGSSFQSGRTRTELHCANHDWRRRWVLFSAEKNLISSFYPCAISSLTEKLSLMLHSRHVSFALIHLRTPNNSRPSILPPPLVQHKLLMASLVELDRHISLPTFPHSPSLAHVDEE